MPRKMVPFLISAPELAHLERRSQLLNTLRGLLQRARRERSWAADLPLRDVGFVRRGETVEVRLYFGAPD